jgi:hypothetical protein
MPEDQCRYHPDNGNSNDGCQDGLRRIRARRTGRRSSSRVCCPSDLSGHPPAARVPAF